VDTRERYGYRFAGQQVDVERRSLAVGAYAVEVDGRIVAAVERKSLADLTSSLTSGKLRFALSELSALPHATVVVEDRWSSVFKLPHLRPAVVADGLAELAARLPSVPVMFAETRQLTEEWTYRWLAAALIDVGNVAGGELRLAGLVTAGDMPVGPAEEPTPRQVRAWAISIGLPVSDRGRLRPDVIQAWREAHSATG
jgi:hypothetical protein